MLCYGGFTSTEILAIRHPLYVQGIIVLKVACYTVFKETSSWAEDAGQLVECLPGVHKAHL